MTQPIQHLPSNTDTVHWGYFDGALDDVLSVDQNCLIRVDTVSGGAERFPENIALNILPDHRDIVEKCVREVGSHILTGPIHVNGCKAGDTLCIDVLDVTVRQNWGWNSVTPNSGPIRFDLETEETIHIEINQATGMLDLPWGPSIKIEPFFGIMGVAPPLAMGRVSSIIPGAFGGNIDNKNLTAGSTLYLPTFRDGAGVSVGDGHAIQGDGEVCEAALETSMQGLFRFRVIDDLAIDFPLIQSDDHVITLALDDDHGVAARQAIERMIDVLALWYGISKIEAYRHCSMFSDLHFTQIVNGVIGVHMKTPKSTLPEIEPSVSRLRADHQASEQLTR